LLHVAGPQKAVALAELLRNEPDHGARLRTRASVPRVACELCLI
jgi:hypothetical protein